MQKRPRQVDDRGIGRGAADRQRKPADLTCLEGGGGSSTIEEPFSVFECQLAPAEGYTGSEQQRGQVNLESHLWKDGEMKSTGGDGEGGENENGKRRHGFSFLWTTM